MATLSRTHTLIVLITASAATLVSGCSTAQSARVRPWQRGLLADSIMDPNRDPVGTATLDHVYFSREGSEGGRGVGGAGCGCN